MRRPATNSSRYGLERNRVARDLAKNRQHRFDQGGVEDTQTYEAPYQLPQVDVKGDVLKQFESMSNDQIAQVYDRVIKDKSFRDRLPTRALGYLAQRAQSSKMNSSGRQFWPLLAGMAAAPWAIGAAANPAVWQAAGAAGRAVGRAAGNVGRQIWDVAKTANRYMPTSSKVGLGTIGAGKAMQRFSDDLPSYDIDPDYLLMSQGAWDDVADINTATGMFKQRFGPLGSASQFMRDIKRDRQINGNNVGSFVSDIGFDILGNGRLLTGKIASILEDTNDLLNSPNNTGENVDYYHTDGIPRRQNNR